MFLQKLLINLTEKFLYLIELQVLTMTETNFINSKQLVEKSSLPIHIISNKQLKNLRCLKIPISKQMAAKFSMPNQLIANSDG